MPSDIGPVFLYLYFPGASDPVACSLGATYKADGLALCGFCQIKLHCTVVIVVQCSEF